MIGREDWIVSPSYKRRRSMKQMTWFQFQLFTLCVVLVVFLAMVICAALGFGIYLGLRALTGNEGVSVTTACIIAAFVFLALFIVIVNVTEPRFP